MNYAPIAKVVALYCRLSPRPDGSYEGVDVQERWGREYAEQHWPDTPVEVFADKGISAANGDHRPEYERLRQWVADGRVGYLWAVEQTRLERREIQWFQLAAELDAAGLAELHTNRDGIVQVQDEVSGVKAVLAAGEARKLRKRTNEMLAERAAEGRPSGGECWPYEHVVDDDGRKALRLIPDRAAALRDAGDKILAGWSRANVARHLNEQGGRGVRGAEFTYSTVGKLLTNPTVAGFRVYRGRIVGRGTWEPVFDEQAWREIRAKITGQRTVETADGRTYAIGAAHFGHSPRSRRKFLLTGGLAVCGGCGDDEHPSPLGAQNRRVKGRTLAALYFCTRQHCVGIHADRFEDHVRDVLLDELDKPEFLEQLAADNNDARRQEIDDALAEADRKRRSLSAMWSRNELTDSEWQTARDDIAAQEAALYAELAELPPPVVDVDISQVRQAWPDMLLDEKREIVRMFIERVTVYPVGKGIKAVDDRVRITWRRR